MKKSIFLFLIIITTNVFAEMDKAGALKLLKQKNIFYNDKKQLLSSDHKGKLTDADMKLLKYFSELKYLNIDNEKITDIGLAEVKELTTIRSINLSGTLISDKGLEALERLSHLDYLALVETNINGIGLRYISDKK